MPTKTSVWVALLIVGACASGSSRPPRGGAPATSPAVGTYRFAVIGDFGTGGTAEYAVAEQMCARHEKRPFAVVITTGDNIYPDGAPDRFEAAFFAPFACLLDAGVPWHATLGNHDIRSANGKPELDEKAFGMMRRNYVVRDGGIRFVLADSNVLRWKWLRRALTPVEGDRWTVVAFHHPVFSPGTVHGSTPGLRPRLPRLFQRKGVDLVFNGHDHLYAVTKPIRGIRYVVTGGGGGALYGCGEAWFSQRCRSKHHFLSVAAGSESLSVRAVGPGGRIFHRFRTEGLD